MFGYIKIQKSELLVREYEAYKSVYCGLCKQIGKEYSVFSRFILSYDSTFYAMLLLSLNRGCEGFENKNCVFNPLKKCTYCKTGSDSFSKASALSVILAYYKLVDDINDNSFLKKSLFRIIKPLFSHWCKKAGKKYPEILKLAKKMLEKQLLAEAQDDCLLDLASEPTAEMLGTILKLEGNSDSQKRILYQMGYGLGRFIYLADAVDDYSKDKKTGSFNPFNSVKENKYETMKNNLSQALAMTYDAYSLLDLVDFKGITDNIILKGLPMVQEEILKKVKGEV